MPHVTSLLDVWRMLEECAPGHVRRPSKHVWIVRYDGRTAVVPLGPHGRRVDPDIETGHIRSLVRAFGIESCARQILELN